MESKLSTAKLSQYKRLAGFKIRKETDEAASKKLGVSSRTIRNWKKSDEYQSILSELLHRKRTREFPKKMLELSGNLMDKINGADSELERLIFRRPDKFIIFKYSERLLEPDDRTNVFGDTDSIIVYCTDCHNRFFSNFGTWYKYQNCVSCDKKTFSKGEKAIKTVLEKLDVPFTWEYPLFIYSDSMLTARADFVFNYEDSIAVIEFDGRQHFESIDFFGGEEQFNKQKQLDYVRRKAMSDLGIPMLRIPYWDYDNINEIVTSFVTELTS